MGNTVGASRSNQTQDFNNNYLDSATDDTSWLQAVEKSFTFVWCDASIGSEHHLDDAKNTLVNIGSVVNRNRKIIHTFNEADACQDFIIHVSNVCLITSGSMGHELVRKIHHLDQVHSIYIFCLNKSRHEVWTKHYRKIRLVCTDIQKVCELLKSDVISQSLTYYDRIEFDVISNDMNLSLFDRNDLYLIYSKLNRIILLNMKSKDHGEQDMIKYCRSVYTTEYLTQLINDFEQNYSKYNPIWWYTKNCFFEGIINRALRAHDLYTLCSMRRFIKDMDLELSKLHTSQRISTEPLNLYCGQLLAEEDFERLTKNCGGLMCVNQFISANPEQGIAVMFIKQQQQQSSTSSKNKVRVLYQIHIDRTKLSTVPYANIGSVSQFIHEDDYLISMSSVYRIDTIEQVVDISSIWLVQLTLLDKNDVQYNNITQCIQDDQLEDIDLTELGHTIKDRLHHFKSTHQLFKQALNRNIPAFRILNLHYHLAIIYDVLGDYDQSLSEYRYVITIARQYIPTCHQNDDLCLAPVYANMALAYEQKNQFHDSIVDAFRALKIVSDDPNKSMLKKELESSCYFTLGSIHDHEGKLSDARRFYEHAFRIRQQYLPLDHADMIVLQNILIGLSSKLSDSDSL